MFFHGIKYLKLVPSSLVGGAALCNLWVAHHREAKGRGRERDDHRGVSENMAKEEPRQGG